MLCGALLVAVLGLLVALVILVFVGVCYYLLYCVV